LEIPARKELPAPPARKDRIVLVHTGAALPVRVWPLERYQRVVQRLRKLGYVARVACDTNQREWWLQHGEADVFAPKAIEELLALLDESGVFLGNDSGPGHLAAIVGYDCDFRSAVARWQAPIRCN
jgi:ADP-heptose:LPS heptosyltransferase